MTFNQVIKHYGSARAAAEALGVTTQCIYKWQKHFPRSSQALVELDTKGKLKMDKKK